MVRCPNGKNASARHAVAPSVCSTLVSDLKTALNASLAVKTAAPRNTISFKKNWPGRAEIPGNPSVGSHPGVVKRKVKVVRNIPTETRLSMPEMRGLTCRSAIPSPRAISITPRRLGRVCKSCLMDNVPTGR
jgi:hypothetical protein